MKEVIREFSSSILSAVICLSICALMGKFLYGDEAVWSQPAELLLADSLDCSEEEVLAEDCLFENYMSQKFPVMSVSDCYIVKGEKTILEDHIKVTDPAGEEADWTLQSLLGPDGKTLTVSEEKDGKHSFTSSQTGVCHGKITVSNAAGRNCTWEVILLCNQKG